MYYYLLLYFKGDRALLDGILTAASLTATYMMTKKWVENWLVWVVIDGAYVLLYCLKDMWLYAILYFLFTAIAFYGWLKWRKTA
jgi:nicotinamide mononucleotide transporter